MKNSIKIYFIFIFMISALASNAQSIQLQEPNYKFNSQKVEAAENSFHFLRSFVDYFYLTLNINKNNFPTINLLQKSIGFCVGDAHPENFGVQILKDQTRIFTANDIDDSGPCPVVFDVFRLLVSTELYASNDKMVKMLKAYLSGVQGLSKETPEPLKDMLKKSNKKGTAPSDKKILNSKFIRSENSQELTTQEIQIMKEMLDSKSKLFPEDTRVLDIMATKKIGGGSGGLQRYEILLDLHGELLHLELKEEVFPASSVIEPRIPVPANHLAEALQLFQGQGLSPYYQIVDFNGKKMLLRPKFSGNIGVDLTKNSDNDNFNLIEFEFYTLGKIHNLSLKNKNEYILNFSKLNQKDLEKEVHLMANFFSKKYLSLK